MCWRGEYAVEMPKPFIRGAEASGTVVTLGPDVTHLPIGMPVISGPEAYLIQNLSHNCMVKQARSRHQYNELPGQDAAAGH